MSDSTEINWYEIAGFLEGTLLSIKGRILHYRREGVEFDDELINAIDTRIDDAMRKLQKAGVRPVLYDLTTAARKKEK